MFDRFQRLIASFKSKAMFRAYPWSCYDHLLFDTIVVKPLGEEKEHHVNGGLQVDKKRVCWTIFFHSPTLWASFCSLSQIVLSSFVNFKLFSLTLSIDL